MSYENLTTSAVEMIEGADPALSSQIKMAMKQISEGTKTNSKEISRSHLVATIRYLLDEFGWLKKSVSDDESSDEFDDAVEDSSTPPGNETDTNGGTTNDADDKKTTRVLKRT